MRPRSPRVFTPATQSVREHLIYSEFFYLSMLAQCKLHQVEAGGECYR